MPKLLQINVSSNWGSTGKIMEAIGNTAISKGWDSYVAYGRSANPSESKGIKIGGGFDPYLHFVYNRLFDLEGHGSKSATRKLVNQIIEIKPDVVQLHNIHDHFLNYQILFEYLNTTSIKVVWTFHDCWAFTGHCYHFIQNDCFKWQTICNNCPRRNMFIDRSKSNFLLKKHLFQKNKNLTIVSCSEWMGNFVKASFLGNKRIEVIHNGIDIDVFRQRKELQKKDGKFHVIAVSNVWLPYKGLKDIFKLRDLLSDDYEIIMVGLSKKQIKSLPAGICGIKRTNSIYELVELYNQADVLINPTYADTFPTVNLEALACGVPVITYRTGGSPEAIDEKTGIVVEQGNVSELKHAVVEMRTKRLSAKDCRNRAEVFFDKRKNYEKYISLYNELLIDK